MIDLNIPDFIFRNRFVDMAVDKLNELLIKFIPSTTIELFLIVASILIAMWIVNKDLTKIVMTGLLAFFILTALKFIGIGL